jgi:hypothetical protein
MSQGKIKINKKSQSKVSNNKLVKDNQITLVNSLHLIADDSDNESVSGDSVSWSDNESHINEEESEEVDEDDEIVDYDKVANEITNSEKTFNEINFEVIKDEKNEKSVKISVSLDLDDSNDIITLEFSISRETFLKIAKELK